MTLSGATHIVNLEYRLLDYFETVTQTLPALAHILLMLAAKATFICDFTI